MQTTCEKCGHINYVRKQFRSLNENDYYWGVVIEEISDFTGFSPQEVHELLKWKFLRIVKGKLESCRSTTNLSVGEFEDYLSQIRQWASEELNCFIPLPNER